MREGPTFDLLPPELSGILARLRANAHSIPLGQMDKVFEAEWVKDWQHAFRRSACTPIAALLGQDDRHRVPAVI